MQKYFKKIQFMCYQESWVVYVCKIDVKICLINYLINGDVAGNINNKNCFNQQ